MFDNFLLMLTSMYKSLVFVTVGIVLLMGFIYILSKKIGQNSKLVGICGIFYNLKMKEKLHLSFLTIKLLFVIACLIEFKSLDLVHLVFLMCLIVLSLVLTLPSVYALKSFGFDAVMMLGVFLINSLQGFRANLYSKTGFTIIIIATSIFVVLYAFYRFVEDTNKLLIRSSKRWQS